MLRYDTPDTYASIFRNWIKAVSNGLEFLRMKNDVQYLTLCQNLSEQQDTLTGLFNKEGFRRLYQAESCSDSFLVALCVGLFDQKYSRDQSKKVAALLDAADVITQIGGTPPKCARIHETTFLCLLKSTAAPHSISEHTISHLIQHTRYMKQYGMDSFVCTTISCDGKSFSQALAQCTAELEQKISVLSERRRDKHYSELIALRNYIYQNPDATFDSVKIHAQFDVSAGYLRVIYKNCFGISFHQDCINARIAKARYLLTATQCTSNEVAERCGYSENKYFMRQFLSETGMTGSRYKAAF